MSEIEMVLFRFNGGQEIRITEDDVSWIDQDDQLLGRASMEQLFRFLKEKLADIRRDASMDHGADAQSGLVERPE